MFSTVTIFASIAAIAAAQAHNDNPLKTVVFPIADLSPEATQTVSSQAGVPTVESDHSHSLLLEITAELRAAGLQVIPEATWRASSEGADLKAVDFVDPSRAVAAAGAAGADLAVLGSFSVHERRLLLSISCYDARTGKLAGRFTKDWPYNLAIYGSLRQETQYLVSHLSSSPVDQPLPALTFTSSQEGMEVLLAGGPSIGRIHGGKLVFTAPGTKPGDTLLVEKRLAGFHTALQSVRSAPTISLLPLTRKSTVAVESSWTIGQLVGAGAAFRYYAVPDFTFISFSIYPYAQGADRSWDNWMLHVDSEISVGSYMFFPPDSLVRLGVSGGLGLIVSTTPVAQAGPPDYLDFYVNPLSAWMELSFPGASFFLRVEGKYAVGALRPNLLGTNIVLIEGELPPVTLGALFKL